MTLEQNKAIVRRGIEAVNAHNLDVLDEILSPEQAAGVRETLQWLDTTFAGHTLEITDMLAEGDQVWVRVTSQATHSGEFHSIPATGKQWTNRIKVSSFIASLRGRLWGWRRCLTT